MNKIISYGKISFAIIWLFLISCNKNSGSHDGKGGELDSAKVIKQSLVYIFNTNKFAPTYYTQPIKIVKSPNLPSDLDFSIMGKKCELVDKPAEFHTDLFKPIPYVEVEKIKFINGESAEVDLIFRATGHWFMLELNKDEKSDWKVVEMREATI